MMEMSSDARSTKPPEKSRQAVSRSGTESTPHKIAYELGEVRYICGALT